MYKSFKLSQDNSEPAELTDDTLDTVAGGDFLTIRLEDAYISSHTLSSGGGSVPSQIPTP